ncbi:hypothetical protein LEMLEM_LOCUS17695, partial [Lemmus lemmus]
MLDTKLKQLNAQLCSCCASEVTDLAALNLIIS